MRKPSKSEVAMVCVVATVVLANWLTMLRYPEAAVFGDEHIYSRYAWADADRSLASLLPGRLRLTHHPSFNAHVLSQVGPSAKAFYDGRKPADPPPEYVSALLRRARWFHTLLLACVLVALYYQGICLGLGPWASLLPPIVLAALPRVIFHVHAIWSETLHLFFEACFLGFVLAAHRRRTLGPLLPAGICLGFAVLTRVTLLYFAPIAAIGIGWMFSRHGDVGGRTRRWRLAVQALLIFVVGFGAITTPQLMKNYNQGLGIRLSTNTWRNIEYGLRRKAPGDAPEVNTMAWRKGSKAYKRARGPQLHPDMHVNRELHARQRVVQFVDSLPFGTHVARQWKKMWSMLLRGNSQLAHAVTADRWAPRTASLKPIVQFDRAAWFALVWAGLAGMLFLMWQSAGWAFLASLVIYYFAGLFVAPINARVAVQLSPVLCLFACGGAVWVVRHVADPLLRRLRSSPRS